MSKSKAIISIGVIALMGSINAKAMAEDFNPDSFLDAMQEVTITNAETSNKNNVLMSLKSTFTGIDISLENILKYGGVFEDPFQKGETILIKIDDYVASKALKKDSYKNEKIYKQLKSSMSTAILREGRTHFHSDTIDGLDSINLDLNQINAIAKDNNMIKEKDLFKLFVFYHEYAHSKNHQERSNYDAFMKTIRTVSGEHDKIHTLSSENFADSYALLEITKKILKDIPDKKEAKKIVDSFSTKVFKWRMKDSKHESKTEYPDHATMPSLYATKKFIDINFDHIADFSELEVNKIAASITNRVLNHKEINKHLHSKQDMKRFLKSNSEIKSALSKSTRAVLKEVDSFVMVNSDKSYSFKYDSEQISKTLKSKPSTYKY